LRCYYFRREIITKWCRVMAREYNEERIMQEVTTRFLAGEQALKTFHQCIIFASALSKAVSMVLMQP